MKNPIATIKMNSGKKIVIELMPECAPNTVNSFIYLAEKGLFDNREIKRIVPGFVIQPTYDSFDRQPECNIAIEGEFRANGFENNLKIEKGVVALGGDGEKISGSSCFFITLSDEAGAKLDGKFAGFGKVIKGYDEVERIERVKTKAVDIGIENVTVNEPVVPEIIESIKVETFGKKYKEPIISGIAD